ncbi:hypothetical protein POM88_018187 [Heracleum sosnowskyi]|uniref:Uncharacterized protein n=1 Tax=Heracleum sosnowskyi TaxID=360622 RepID=A0AAD8IQ18_9APIA|nr:hypothetical protein POM88_018187 [Heracleum sosnowskyi]
MGISLGQMDPNGFLHMNGFQCRCLGAEVEPTTRLFWHHYDFRKNGKSRGFYSVSRRTNRADWVERNSNNKGIHDKWFYNSGPKIASMSQWRVVDPAVQVVKPTLIGAEEHEYSRLCYFDMDRIPLGDLRDKQWLFALRVSTHQAIMERKKAKFQASQAAQAGGSSNPVREGDDQNAPEKSAPPSPRQQPKQTGKASLSPASRKRAWRGDVVKMYVPQWAALETDSFATPAPMAAKDLAPDLCRALMLPADRPKYERLSPVDSCAELMGMLSMATPMAAAITDKVKDMQSGFAQGQAKVLKEDKVALQKEIDVLRARLTRRNLALKAARTLSRKEAKLRLNVEERCYQMGHDEVVKRAAALGLDHLPLIEEGFIDSVGRPDDEELPVVSSGEDEELSE